MRTIGLIGGMSWESTALYYRIINREVARRLGGLRSASLLMSSLDFEEVVARQKAGAWSELAALLGGAAARLERAGAHCLLIGTNTMHRVAPEVEAAISVPLLHIADAAVAALSAAGCRRVALLGTRYTMEQPFYAAHLARHGIDCVVPDAADRAEVHRVIFEELCKGDFDAGSRQAIEALAVVLERRVHRRHLQGFAEECRCALAHGCLIERRHGCRLHGVALTISRRRAAAKGDAKQIGLVGIEQESARLGGLTEADRQEAAGERVEASRVACLARLIGAPDALQGRIRAQAFRLVEQDDPVHLAIVHSVSGSGST